MFTGIVEELGTVTTIQKLPNLFILKVRCRKIFKKVKVSDSVAVDGVCLTVTAKRSGILVFDVMKETLRATAVRDFRPGIKVNLEPALKVGGFLGGHFVTGHIDGIGKLEKRIMDKNFVELWIAVDQKLIRYIVAKGSVGVNGVSLTVGKVQGTRFSVYLIPYTLAVTNLGQKKPSDRLNIETDILAKYVLKPY